MRISLALTLSAIPWVAQAQPEWTWSNPQEYPAVDVVISTFLLPINLDDPESDFQAGIRNGDYRVLCLRGLAVDCPGMDSDQPPQFGYRLVEGSSDAIDNPEHGKIMAQVHEYSFRYNALILKFIKTKETAACGRN